MIMTMEMFKNFLFAYFGCFLAFTVLVHAQSQSGFISIDCGIPDNSSYTDKTTGLTYVSDSAFTDAVGISNTISIEYASSNGFDQQFGKLRSFPDGDRNCYTLRPSDGKGTKYLIRARFLYGNYDGEDKPPAFDLYIGANKWSSVKLENASADTTLEIIHIPLSESLFVCLVNTGHGTPFISALELRPLKNSTYADTRAAVLYRRMDIGSQSNKPTRYKDDVYDRIWKPFSFAERNVLNTSLTIDANMRGFLYQPPQSVMETAMTPANGSSDTFAFFIRPDNPAAEYYVHMHFCELEKLEANQSREFTIYENGEHMNGPFSPDYLYTTTISSTEPASGERIDYEINKTETSTLPPLLNALEVYIIQNFTEPETHEPEVKAMIKIKSEYGVKRNWQGDPCAPRTYAWDGLNCSVDGEDPLRIISLNLSSSGLVGEIVSHISDLTMIQYLDLSNNSLTGSVPDFLSKMQFLKLLDLRGNNLTGSVPPDLVERSINGSLLLSVSENLDLCSSLSCQKKNQKKNNFMVPVIASIATMLVLLIVLVIGWKIMNRTRAVAISTTKFGSEILHPKNQEFTYSDIIAITNNFERVIGKGGFGTVYHGYLNDTQVAVKMLSTTSSQGPKEFQAEVKLLMRVHHRNLTSLIGYCYDDDHMGLVYEYMANGNLGRHLSAKNVYALSWEDRIQIAVDAAQGLEYLHHGCKPPIVHRDVKTANILLTEKFQAKVADFGLSRDFPTEGATHVTTVVAGTPGYLDPESFQTNWLNEKSDIYSFGVVLLEIITSRPVISKGNDHDENYHISDWTSDMLENGEIKSIVDERLQGQFDVNSAWKAVEIATACLKSSSERPTMNEVVVELKECLALERASNKRGSRRRKDSDRTYIDMDSDLNPLAR